MILLDTNAVLWVDQGHPRARVLTREHRALYLSPATVLELQVLQEAGRLRRTANNASLTSDDRWTLDDPPAAAWFEAALELAWTRDTFDRLLAAHARLRGWRLATADAALLEGLGPRHTLEL